MLSVKEKNIDKSIDSTSKLELFRLIGEGFRAMQEGRESTIEEVEERIKRRNPLSCCYGKVFS